MAICCVIALCAIAFVGAFCVLRPINPSQRYSGGFLLAFTLVAWFACVAAKLTVLKNQPLEADGDAGWQGLSGHYPILVR